MASADDANAAAPPGRRLAPGLYHFDELAVGDWFTTPGAIVDPWHVNAFAGLTGDFFELHMDDAAARALGFPRRVAHGLLGLALTDGLKNRAQARLAAIASLGWSWEFRAPILLGDRIAATVRIAALRASQSKPDRGIATLAIAVTNQDGTLVQEGENRLLMKRRLGTAASPPT